MKKQISLKKIEEFKEYLINEEKSKATVEKYIRDVISLYEFTGKKITKSEVLEYKERVLSGYAVTSANSMIAAINSFFSFLGWNELCLKRFKVQRESYCPIERELTKEEYVRLVEAAKIKNDERLCLIIQTICSCGIRVSELKHITVEAVLSGEAYVECKGKIRRIFVISRLKDKLLAYAKKHNIKEGPIFITKSGNPICRYNVWKMMKSLCKYADVDSAKVFPHNLRHLFARTFYSNEKDIAKLADILGHSSVNTTRVYVATSCSEHRKKMENMHLVL